MNERIVHYTRSNEAVAGNNVNKNDIKQTGAKIPDKIETWQMTEPGKLAIASLGVPEIKSGEPRRFTRQG